MRLWPFDRQAPSKHSTLAALEEYFNNLDRNRSIDTYEFVVLDSELSGLNTRRDEIVSIAAVRIKNLCIILDDFFCSHIKIKKRSITEGVFVHRITPEQSRIAPDPEIVIPEFVKFCGTAILVGHFLHIDLGFLNNAAERIMGGRLPHACLDTRNLADQLHQIYARKDRVKPAKDWSFRLDRLAKEYRLPAFQEHDALCDAIQTAYLFLFLVENLRREGLTTLTHFCSAKSKQPDHVIPAY